jgi:hypothetical protein
VVDIPFCLLHSIVSIVEGQSSVIIKILNATFQATEISKIHKKI